jgi:hypothetical protein
MRLPGFTAERSISRAAGGYPEVSARERSDGSNRVMAAYFCTDTACVCSGLVDCVSCIFDPKACGNKGSYTCSGGTCLFSRFLLSTGNIVKNGGVFTL